jgi:Zn-dependent protease with chaperone function
MTTAVYLVLYGLLVTWLSPPLLSRLTRDGLNPRFGVVAWLTAIAAVLVAWVAAIVVVIVESTGELPNSPAVVVCLELLGLPEHVANPGWLSLLLVVGAGVGVVTVVAIKTGRSALELRSRSRDHASAARIIGAPTKRPDVFVVTAERPAAYCVVGRPNAIVITSAAVDELDGRQLNAVLAHEVAHISGRHHQLLMLVRALAGTLSWLPLFTRGADAIADLLEMCADDTAARRHGRGVLVAGMIKLAGPATGRAAGLAVGANAVVIRANRLLEPARRQHLWGHQLLISATIAATASAPFVINLICGH